MRREDSEMGFCCTLIFFPPPAANPTATQFFTALQEQDVKVLFLCLQLIVFLKMSYTKYHQL